MATTQNILEMSIITLKNWTWVGSRILYIAVQSFGLCKGKIYVVTHFIPIEFFLLFTLKSTEQGGSSS